jgi:hypothetical protein
MRVSAIFRDCLFRTGEPTDNHVLVEGITRKVGLEAKRLEGHRKDIIAMLHELPKEFMKSSGNHGASFLDACTDKHGRLWTGLHETMEELFLLGMAIKKVNMPFPRLILGSLKGGMPHYLVIDDDSEVETPTVAPVGTEQLSSSSDTKQAVA